MPTCPFCGFTGKLIAEHVFGNWLSRIGLDLTPVAHGAGPLNLLGQDLGGVRRSAKQCTSALRPGAPTDFPAGA